MRRYLASSDTTFEIEESCYSTVKINSAANFNTTWSVVVGLGLGGFQSVRADTALAELPWRYGIGLDFCFALRISPSPHQYRDREHELWYQRSSGAALVWDGMHQSTFL